MIREHTASDVAGATSAVRPAGFRSAVARFFSIENRYLPPIFITLILLVG